MKNRILTILFLLFAFLMTSCMQSEDSRSVSGIGDGEYGTKTARILRSLENDPDNIDCNLLLWGNLLRLGKGDDLIRHAGAAYRRSLENGNDTLTTFSAAYLAQAFLLANKMDSVPKYLNSVNREFLDGDDILNAIIDNISATYSIRAELNYTKALNDFMRAYKVLENIESRDNQVAVLCNIANIYYEKGDTSGLDFARRALLIAEKIESVPMKVNTFLVNGQLLCLAGRYNESLSSLDKAYDLTLEVGMDYILPLVEVSYADLYFAVGNQEKADRLYRQALSHIDKTDSGTAISIMYKCGSFFASMRQYPYAKDLYAKALELSYSSKNIECREKLLSGLSDVTFLMGNKETALDYYRMAQNYADSILSKQKEMEFNRMQVEYQKQLHKDEMTIKELDLKNTKRTSVIIILVLVILAASSIAAFLMVRRRNRMYRVMIDLHQEQVKRKKAISEMVDTVDSVQPAGRKTAEEETEDEMLRNIYLNIEKLMKEEKLYKDKEVSLNMIAEKLDTNRAYISRAINAYSKNTFYNYINVYRMDEATSILSDPENDVPLKRLADELGYNSISAFYRAFQNETGCPPSKYREEIRRKAAQ